MAKPKSRKAKIGKRYRDFFSKQKAAKEIAGQRTNLQASDPAVDPSFNWMEQPIPEWGRARMFILRRDKFSCRGCGLSARTWNGAKHRYDVDYSMLQIHHVLPRRFGGDERQDNLVSLCAGCHKQTEFALHRSGVLAQHGLIPFDQFRAAALAFTDKFLGEMR